MITQNSVFQKIIILHKIRSIKKYILYRNIRLLKSIFISTHSILGWASVCMNYCINVARHGDNQSVTLLRCNEAQVLQVICIVGSGVSHLDSL